MPGGQERLAKSVVMRQEEQPRAGLSLEVSLTA